MVQWARAALARVRRSCSLAVVGLHQPFELLQRLAELARLGQHLIAVGQQHIAPELGVACADAGEVAKAGPASDSRSSARAGSARFASWQRPADGAGG
jgi:hypothetical protein